MRTHIRRASTGLFGVFALVLLVSTLLPGRAAAYSYSGHHWDYGSPTYVDFTIASNIPYDWTAPLSAGAAAWNSAGAKYRFRGGYADHNVARRSLSTKYIAQTYVREWFWTSRITDRDTDFNSNLLWSINGGAGAFDVQSVAAHEFGHWLMLDDLYGGSDYWKTMYGVGAPGQTYQRTLDTDDINGIRAIYGM